MGHRLQRFGREPIERETLALANAVENGCRCCTAIHATFASKAGLDAAEIERVRSKSAPSAPRLAALTALGRALIRERGRPSESVLESFLAAGLSREQALEVVLGVDLSTLANYAGRLTGAARTTRSAAVPLNRRVPLRASLGRPTTPSPRTRASARVEWSA